MHLKISSAKWQPFYFGFNVLKPRKVTWRKLWLKCKVMITHFLCYKYILTCNGVAITMWITREDARHLTHWGRVTHICVAYLTIIVSDNGLSPSRRQAIIWTNAGILIIWLIGANFSEILIEIHTFKNAFKDVVCEKAAILSRPQGVNYFAILRFQLTEYYTDVPWSSWRPNYRQLFGQEVA